MMKLLITHPYYWPYVRRGAEGYIHGLSNYLSKHHYRVKIITSKPGRSKTTVRDGVNVHYSRQFQIPLPIRFGITPSISFMPNALCYLLRKKYDLIHSFFYSDGFAAYLCKKVKSTPYILNFNGVPIAADFNPLDNYFMRKAFKAASAIIVFSQYARKHLLADYKKDGIVIPGAVDLSRFYVTKDKDLDRPKVLCTAAIDQPYKNVALLVKAFELFKTKVPKAILQLSGHVDYQAARKLFNSVKSRTRESIYILGVGRIQDIPKLYAEAAISVLPSVGEAFGIVLIESLASGTPVVGSDSGGIPEVITDPNIGVLFKLTGQEDPRTDEKNLCDAMLQALKLAKNPQTSYRCREHSSQYDWSVIGPQFEAVYQMVMNGSR